MDVKLAVSFVLGGGFALLLVVMAIHLWRGRWLNLIAGNYFVTKEEAKTPEQRQLGRRVAGVIAPCAIMCALVPVAAVAEALGLRAVQAASHALVVIAAVVMVALIVRLFVIGHRDQHAAEERLLAQDPSQEDNIRLNHLQTRVLYGFLVFMLVLYLAAAAYGALAG